MTLARIPTGCPGLDKILGGGFLQGGIYIVMAPPGGGKTILANQLGFHHARQSGGKVVYVTLMAESHSRMFLHLREMAFFDHALVGERIVYLGAYHTLEKDGLDGLLALLQRVILQEKPSILVIDGLAVADEIADSAVAFKRFITELNVFTSGTNCTSLLLSSLQGSANRPELTMVDGIIQLRLAMIGLRRSRDLEVRKFRGSRHAMGRHNVLIDNAGFHVLPRVEAMLPDAAPDGGLDQEQIDSGVPELNRMFNGGIPRASTTVLLGAAGTGKTHLGMHFLAAGAKAGEPGLYWGYYEAPQRLIRGMTRTVVDLQPLVDKGMITLRWQPPLELLLDQVARDMLRIIDERGIKRLFLDGIDGLRDGALRPSRMSRFIVALTNELRQRGVTTYITEELKLFLDTLDAPVSNLSAAIENLVYVRHVITETEQRRSITVVKTRETGHDRVVRSYSIEAGKGIVIGEAIAQPPAGKKR